MISLIIGITIGLLFYIGELINEYTDDQTKMESSSRELK